MKSIISFIKGVKVISWILIVLSMVAYSIISSEETTVLDVVPIAFIYLFVPIITEICSNPVIKNSDLKICQFLSSTKIISRIFMYFFFVVVISCVMPDSDWTGSLVAVFYCLIPAALIEWRRNAFICACRHNKASKKTVSCLQEENNQNIGA